MWGYDSRVTASPVLSQPPAPPVPPTPPAPALTGSRPVGYDATAVMMASGSVAIDCIAGTGLVMVHNLPEPPNLFMYEVELTVALQENTDIPGIANPAPATGALEHTAMAQVVSNYLGNNLPLGAMSPATMAGMWQLDFTSADVDVPLTSVRAARVFLRPTISIPFVGGVLYGRVGADSSSGSTTNDGHMGHVHGV